MGVTIHYSGRIKDYHLIEQLTEELADFAVELNWKFCKINDDRFKGVVIMPPDCDPLLMTFNSEGRLSNIFLSDFVEKTDPLLFSLFTKTQYADVQIHISLVKLLKYISTRYLKTFQVFDEGLYWESESRELLVEQIDKNNFAIKHFCDTMSGLKRVEGETAGELTERTIQKLGRMVTWTVIS